MKSSRSQGSVHVREAATSEDREFVRVLRNSSSRYWTGDKSEISPEKQREWWEKRAEAGFKLFIFSQHSMDVGYLLLRREDRGGAFLTLAVVDTMRNRGLGSFIYNWAKRNYSSFGYKAVYAQIHTWNVPSIVAALKGGFAISEASGGIVELFSV